MDTPGAYNRELYEQGEAVTISNTFPYDDGYYTIMKRLVLFNGVSTIKRFTFKWWKLYIWR